MPLARERIAHYRILCRLGSGGMGEVYLAEDERFPRPVALKVIATERSADETTRRRFLREAQAVAALSHPGIAHVYEAGSDAGTDYIAMEHIDGETLAQRMSGEPVSIDAIIEIGTQLADAIAEAHDHGVMHRDIKPSNIMLTRRGHVKVLDFGLAKIDVGIAAQPSESSTARVPSTRDGALVGTVNYMSPEQAVGGPVERRSDVFSIGVVLYELITRRLPFAGRSTGDTLHRITSVEPEPLARFNYDLPIELERIVRKCLEKVPDRRYRSARELHADIEALMRHRSNTPSAPWVARARTSRRKSYSILAAFVAIAIVVGGYALWRARRASPLPVHMPRLRAVAVLPFTTEREGEADQYLADGLTEAAINRLGEDGNLRVIARSTAFRFKRSALLPQEIGRQLHVDIVVTGSLRSRNGAVHLIAELVSVNDGARIWAHTYDGQSTDLLRVEDDLGAGLAAAFHSPDSSRVVRTANDARSEAHNWYLRGEFAFHGRRMSEAMASFQSAIDADPTYAAPYAAQAGVASVLGRYLDIPAAQTWPIARAASEKALRLDPRMPEAHVALGSVRDTYEWNWAGAESEYRRAIALRPADVLAHQWLALLLSRLGRHDEALREIAVAQTLDPLSPVVSSAAANILYYARRPDDAMQQCARAIQLDGTFALARIQLGLILDQKGQSAEAVRQLAAFGAVPRASNAGVAAFAIAAAHAGNRDVARDLLHDLEQRAPAQSTEYFAAAVHAALEERDAAFFWLERAYRAHNAYLGFAKVDPALDPLRDDPRFSSLIARLHLG
jgi:TolB-like protein/Tfp pilus assembly protein PilF